MKKFLVALAFLPLAAGLACASEALTDPQMDRVVAGNGSTVCISPLCIWLHFHHLVPGPDVTTTAQIGGQTVETSHSFSSTP